MFYVLSAVDILKVKLGRGDSISHIQTEKHVQAYPLESKNKSRTVTVIRRYWSMCVKIECFAAQNKMIYCYILTLTDWTLPYLALIFGSLTVARFVPMTVNRVPPLRDRK